MKRFFKSWAVIVFTIALAAIGCSSSDKPSAKPESPGTPTQSEQSSVLRIKDKGVTAKGGTVYVLQAGGFSSLDPADNYNTAATDVGRLVYRTLTFIDDTAGEDPSIQPDLAESLGTASDNGRTWTYKLRAGLKYEDGRPITAADVKYGVMRSFESDLFTQGATWMPDLLANETSFGGPYSTPDKDLTSVETPDDRTLIFHFSGPQPDADWIMSLFYTSPVPKDKDTRQDYGKRPIASGPYKIEEYTADKSLVLVRNEKWDPAIDSNRPAYPDRFQFELDVKAPAASERLFKSEGNDAFAVPLDGILQVSDFPRAEDPAIKPRLVNGPGACVNYIAMNTQTIKDPDVRHAIALAIDRQGIQALEGGQLKGSVVDSIIPSDIPGFIAPDLGLKPAGDPEAAKKLLAGKSVPPLHIAVSDSLGAAGKKEVEQYRANLEAVGLKLVVDPHPYEDLATVVDEAAGWDLADNGGWCFDWPTAGSIVLPVLGPDVDGTSWGSNNAAKYFNPKFSDQLQEMKSATDDSAALAKKFVDIANEIQTTDWPLLPTMRQNNPEVVGTNVTNVGVSPLLGQVDLNTLAVKKG